MGVTISSFFNRFFDKKQIKIMMMGLMDAGKTTILYKLKTGEIVNTIPTIGFNVEILTHKNISFTVWDIAGGGDKIQPLWRHYYPNTQAVIFVVDSTNRECVEEAEDVLKNYILYCDELQDAILLVLANKQDLPNAMTTNELTDKLKLNELSNRRWYVQPTTAIQGLGLYEALDWLANELAE